MTFAPGGGINSFISTDIILSEDPEELRRILDDTLKRIIDAVNDKDIGHYNTVEETNGQKWFTAGDAVAFRNANRKVINFGALPNTATKSVAHGITTNANTTFTRIYGCATQPGATTITNAIPLPYSDAAILANNVALYVDATNVSIVTGINYAAFTNCFVILEYIQY
jgi:hypothetical protein